MATIIIHAGTSKTGSSSIQRWLQTHAIELYKKDNILILRPSLSRLKNGFLTGEVLFKRCTGGPVQCGNFLGSYYTGKVDKATLVKSFFTGLHEHASKHSTIVVSCEALAQPFCRCDDLFVQGFEDLGKSHKVIVIYYVRPQHSSLESAWKQWGFRSGESPSEYVRNRCSMLHYMETWQWTNNIAPSISFEVRPFRSDLLYNADVVSDFINWFPEPISSDNSQASKVWENRGLPLDIVNVLSAAPGAKFWNTSHDNAKLEQIKKLMIGVELADTEQVRYSKKLLQCYCYDVFEPSNSKLIKQLGWHTDHFISPPENVNESYDLDELDKLWAPGASEPVRLFLYCALERAIEEEPVVSPARRILQVPHAIARFIRSFLSGH